MKVILCDINNKLVAEWQRAFGKTNNVEVYGGDILEYKADAIVSPANSFGFMNDGIDGVYTRHFGSEVQKYLQDQIKQRPIRELLVGETITVPTGNDDIPFMISAPTMRVPLNVSDTANPYLAFKAALIEAKAKGFKTILCPGLGTATGSVEAGDCARQMYSAYYDVFDKFPKFPTSIREACLSYTNLVGIVNINRGRR